MWKEEVLSSPKIKEVKFLTTGYLYDLECAINKALKEGWEIQGNIINPITGGYSVAVVKYGEVEG